LKTQVQTKYNKPTCTLHMHIHTQTHSGHYIQSAAKYAKVDCPDPYSPHSNKTSSSGLTLDDQSSTCVHSIMGRD